MLRKVFSDPTERKYHFLLSDDVEPLVEDNKRLQSEKQSSDWGRLKARVPQVVVTKWLQEEWDRGNVDLRYLGPGFDEWFDKKINDPANKAWRTDNPSNPFYLGWNK